MKTVFFSLLLLINLSSFAQDVDSLQLMNDVRTLSSDKFMGRKTGSKENKLAADYIAERFEHIGLDSYQKQFKHPFTFRVLNKLHSGENVIGYIKGKKSDVIVLSAHFDHIGVVKNKINNGADDNASGIGGLLALATYFKVNRPEYTLIFAAFDAEEMGLRGAKNFVENPPVLLGNIKLNINMDMISHNNDGELYVSGSHYHPILRSYLTDKNPKIRLIPGHEPRSGKDDWTSASDQGAFHSRRIPFLYFGVEDHDDYHKPTDDYENINNSFYYNAVQVILDVARAIDKNYMPQH